MGSWGFDYQHLRDVRPDIIYVSNCGFGHTGPYRRYKTWGPIAQAVCGLTFSAGLAEQPSAGFGFSYMDHHGGTLMALAVLAALHHRDRTGEGQWVDMSTVEGGATLLGPLVLDWSVNGRPVRRPGMPASNRAHHPPMAPHGIYPAAGQDQWVAIVCRDDAEWAALAAQLGPWALAERFATLAGRLEAQDELDAAVGDWTRALDKFAVQGALLSAGVPVAAVQSPPERIDADPSTEAWGAWPEVEHPEMGRVRVDGLPVHLSATDWVVRRGAPCLGQHNRYVFRELLGLDDDELARLEAADAI